MTRQMAKELMLKGFMVTHSTFKDGEYLTYDLNAFRTEDGVNFEGRFYHDDIYKVNWKRYIPQATSPTVDIGREFIIQMFEHKDYTRWRDIAEKLYDNGICIVAGEENIYWSRIDYFKDFINTRKNDSYIGCLEYTFEKERFLNSLGFKEVQESHIRSIRKTIDIHQKKIEALENEILSIEKLNKNV